MFSLASILKPKWENTPIRPWDPQQMNTLIQKLGITPHELNDAILETGSLDLQYIKAYIKRKKYRLLFIKKISNLTTI